MDLNRVILGGQLLALGNFARRGLDRPSPRLIIARTRPLVPKEASGDDDPLEERSSAGRALDDER